MRILQIVPSIAKEAAGPSYSVVRMTRALQEIGAYVELHFLAPVPVTTLGLDVHAYPVKHFPISALGRSPEMLKNLCLACQEADICHDNSLWMLPNIYPGKAVKRTRCKLVISPRGALATWALRRNRWKKWLAGTFLGQYATLRKADMFHATSLKEYEEIREAGYHQPVAIVPIGIDIQEISKIRPQRRKLLFLGRLHLVKAVDRLLNAWAQVADEFSDWDFQIVGPDCGLGNALHTMTMKKNIPRVEFLKEQNGKAKFQFYAAADLYVLPSFTENFGITVAEALSCGTPVVVSRTIPWNGVLAHKCGWVTDNTTDALADTLRIAMARSREDLEILGANGKEWMRKDFSWEEIAHKMMKTYEWLINGGICPDWVKL